MSSNPTWAEAPCIVGCVQLTPDITEAPLDQLSDEKTGQAKSASDLHIGTGGRELLIPTLGIPTNL